MEDRLVNKLRAYIAENNPEIMLKQLQQLGLTSYLHDKVKSVMPLVEGWLAAGIPEYEVEELAMKEMTKEFLPSKFNYIKNILLEEFPEHYQRFVDMGVLNYEGVNLIEVCNPTFETFGFSEEMLDDPPLRYVIIASISDYLEKS